MNAAELAVFPIERVAFIVGMAVGTIAALASIWVWVRHQQFGMGGGSLMVMGFLLIGLSVFGTIKINVTASGLTAEVQRLAQRVDTTAAATHQVAEQVGRMAETVEVTRSSVRLLTEAPAIQRLVEGPAIRGAADSLRALRPLDQEALRRATATLGRQRLIRLPPPPLSP